MASTTYSLRFLGPGLARARGLLAPSRAAAPRLVPALDAAGFHVLPGTGAASDDGVLAPLRAAAGESAAAVVVVVAASGMVGAGDASGVEPSLDAGEGCAARAWWGNCDSVRGDSLRMAVNLLAGLDVDDDDMARTQAGDGDG